MTVGDVTSDARGAGARFNANKPEFHQLPLFSLVGVIRILEYGAKKYAPGNWLKGQPWTVPFDSMMRHMAAWQRGEELDSESGLPHLDHALCNLIFLSAYRDVYPEGDNRWPAMQEGGIPTKETKDNVDRRESEEHRGESAGVDGDRPAATELAGGAERGEDVTFYATGLNLGYVPEPRPVPGPYRRHGAEEAGSSEEANASPFRA